MFQNRANGLPCRCRVIATSRQAHTRWPAHQPHPGLSISTWRGSLNRALGARQSQNRCPRTRPWPRVGREGSAQICMPVTWAQNRRLTRFAATLDRSTASSGVNVWLPPDEVIGPRSAPPEPLLNATPPGAARCRCFHRQAATAAPSSNHARQSARDVFMTNLSLYLVESADMYPDGPALRCDGVTTTFSELADNAARFAAYLDHRGVHPGDRVGIMLTNRPEFATVFYGVLHAGAVVVPMDPLRNAREVAFVLTNTGARLLVFARSCWRAATAGALAAGVPPIGIGKHT